MRSESLIVRVSSIVVAAPLALVVLTSPASASEGVEVGSVVARGTLLGGFCHLASPTTLLAEYGTAVTATFNDGCELVVTAIVRETADPQAPLVTSAFADNDPVAAAGAVDTTAEPRTKVPRSGHTKTTVTEQFGITAYEVQVDVHALQDTVTGSLSSGTFDGYCYASAFPGNYVSDCFGRMPSRRGSYVEAWGYGTFDNKVLGGPRMVLFAQHDITATGWAGRCAILEGGLPPLWSMTCQVVRHS
jgi:hypothetical protein